MGPRGRLVYSSDGGRTCPKCRRLVTACRCKGAKASKAPSGPQGAVRVRLDTKKRRGKVVTLVEGIVLPADKLTKLAKALKRRVGSGGTAKDGVIELQGDHRDTVVAELEERGYRVRS
ncbi:MAG: hypothetical protein QNJ98_09725 [Planctomycetota bacterium]|nr:hypothetical protein [Planctomycetota bacterium]